MKGFQKGNSYNKTHGLTNSRIYKIWHSMKCRCLYSQTNGYSRYGGRGIKICDEWNNDFMSFYNWAINNGYRDDLTLDRIDVNGNYYPENCKWSTREEQCRNRRNNRLITYKNKTKTQVEWCNIFNISATTLNDRLKRGWTIDQALTISTKGNHRKIKK